MSEKSREAEILGTVFTYGMGALLFAAMIIGGARLLIWMWP